MLILIQKDRNGRLYNRPALLQALLDKKVAVSLRHITNLVLTRVKPSPESAAFVQPTRTFAHVAQFICPGI